MAVGDKLVTLDGLKAVYQDVNGNVNDLKSAFVNDVGQITGNEPLVFQSGVYRTSSSATAGQTVYFEVNANYVTAISPCSYGDVFSVHVYGSSSSRRAYYICDGNMVVLSGGIAPASTEYNGTITVTVADEVKENVRFIVFNNLLNSLPSGYYAYKGNNINYKLDTVNMAANGLRGAVESELGNEIFVPDKNGYYYTASTSKTFESVDDRLTPNAGWCCMLIPCVAGQIYHVHSYGTSGVYRAWIVFNAAGERIGYADKTGQIVDEFITIPANGAYLAVNNQIVNNAECWAVLSSLNGTFDFHGKNVAIIGDSISTNGNYSENNLLGNVPEIVVQEEDVGQTLSAYATYNDIGTTIGGHTITDADVGTELEFTPVPNDVGTVIGKPANNNAASVDVWWEVASRALGFNPIPVAWSGASITSHEGESDQYKTSYAWHPAQIRKCGIRTPGSMERTAPDMVIIARGTNDLSHDPASTVTEYFENIPSSTPNTDTYTDGGETKYGFIEGLVLTIEKIREAYPNTRIVLCTLNYFKRSGSTVKTRYQYNRAICEVADYMSTGLIEFHKDGLTYANASSTYYQDATNYTHPTTAGHKVLANRAIMDLKKLNSME